MPTTRSRPQGTSPDFKVHGGTGLPIFGGRVYDEELTVLQGERGRRIIREMSEQDPIIGGILFAIEMLARQVQWRLKPANDSAAAKELAEYVEGCLLDMTPSFQQTLSEIFSMLPFGWSWFEILYKRRYGLVDDPLGRSKFDDGKVGWRGWAIRSQETLYEWVYDEENELVALKQLPPPDYQMRVVPRRKSLHFVTRSRRQNPEGVSILRTAYRSWYLKKNIETVEGIGIERDLAGLPIMWVPPEILATDATPEQQAQREALKKIVTTIRRDEQEGVLMPLAYDDQGRQIYDLKLLSTGGSRQFDTDKIVNRYDQRIAMSMLADFILLGHDAVGSFALSDDKTALFSTAMGSFLDAIATEVTANGIPELVRLNGGDARIAPSLEHGDIESLDLTKLGLFMKQLADAGMPIFPNPELEAFLLEQAGLPTTINFEGIPRGPIPRPSPEVPEPTPTE
jgi:hypothetical protein